MNIPVAGFCSITLPLRLVRWLTFSALLSSLATLAWPQSISPPSSAPGAPVVKPQASMPATAPRPSKPAWRSLSPQQQQALKPLAAHWETLNSDRKRKWLEISKNYFALPVAEQEKMHGRMREWVLMGQQQRNRARLNFAEFQRLTPEEKSSQWQAYQALTLEEKRQLAATAPKKPVGAAAIKPVPPQKLTVIPITRNTPKEAAPASSALTIQRNTLLPQPPPAPSPVESTPEQAEQTEHTDNKDSH